MLDNYETNPINETRKIWDVLKKQDSYQSLWDSLDDDFSKCELSAHESSLNNFYTNFIWKNEIYNGLNDFEISVLRYRLFVELILYLFDFHVLNAWSYDYGAEMDQIKLIIDNGLKKCGYGLKESNKKVITYKLDIVAETTAANNKHYSEDIFDYLIAKTAEEKEKALTSLSIKLEAVKPIDGFTKSNRDYVQMMRHKEERISLDKYSWFYKKSDYSKNLDKLFKILICYISHIDCAKDVAEFDNKCHNK